MRWYEISRSNYYAAEDGNSEQILSLMNRTRSEENANQLKTIFENKNERDTMGFIS